MDCNNSRGLLISDHLAKSFTTLLKNKARDSYEGFVHEEQCGCIRGKGTEFATHIIRSFIDYCHMSGLCFFVLFLDLEKAFDRVIREFLLDMPSTLTEDPVEYITSLGLPQDRAAELVAEILSNGPFLQQIGVPAEYVSLITSLHSCSWFSYGTLASAIVTRTGGRQGCKLGDLIFNLVYERALRDVRQALTNKHYLLELPAPCGTPFWMQPGGMSNSAATLVYNATYVDDEAACLCARSAKQLDIMIDEFLDVLISTFCRYGLKINFAKGKSEAILKYVGKASSAALERRRVNDKVLIKLPATATEEYLQVVNSYKHLGSIVTVDRKFVPDSDHRVQLALNAFSPLVGRVFGASMLSQELQLGFAWSLVFSRLFYNIHLWSAMQIVAVKRLNAMYMRVLRRVANNCRYDGPAESGVTIRR